MDGLGFLFLILFPATSGVQYLQVLQPKSTMFSYSHTSVECSYELECARMCSKDSSCASFAYIAADEMCKLFSFYLSQDEDGTESSGTVEAYTRMGICDENYSPFDGMCWRFFDSRRTYISAQATCNEDHADLLQIQTPAKMEYVELFNDVAGLPWGTVKHRINYWLRPSDQVTESYWVWSNGEAVSNWCRGNPDNLNDEDCLVLLTGRGCFNDRKCHSHFRFICEKRNKLAK